MPAARNHDRSRRDRPLAGASQTHTQRERRSSRAGHQHPDCYYCCMIDADRWGAIRDLADRQFGLFTTAQARHLGVAPYVLARLAERETIIRVHHGVYELPESSAWTTVGDWAL